MTDYENLNICKYDINYIEKINNSIKYRIDDKIFNEK